MGALTAKSLLLPPHGMDGRTSVSLAFKCNQTIFSALRHLQGWIMNSEVVTLRRLWNDSGSLGRTGWKLSSIPMGLHHGAQGWLLRDIQRLTISHYWALELGGAQSLVHSLLIPQHPLLQSFYHPVSIQETLVDPFYVSHFKLVPGNTIQLIRYHLCPLGGGRHVNRKWPLKDTYIMVEGSL